MAKEGTPAPVFTAITSIEDQRGMSTAPVARADMAQGSALAARAPAPLSRADIRSAAPDLDKLVRRTAELMPQPTELDDGTSLSRFSSSGTELTVFVTEHSGDRDAVTNAICQQRAIAPLLHQGATVRTVFEVGSVKKVSEERVMDGGTCGFR